MVIEQATAGGHSDYESNIVIHPDTGLLVGLPAELGPTTAYTRWDLLHGVVRRRTIPMSPIC
jgi:hypothetical protein